jgi:hypothetical protein
LLQTVITVPMFATEQSQGGAFRPVSLPPDADAVTTVNGSARGTQDRADRPAHGLISFRADCAHDVLTATGKDSPTGKPDGENYEYVRKS